MESSSVQIQRAARGEAQRARVLGVVVEVARAVLSRMKGDEVDMVKVLGDT